LLELIVVMMLLAGIMSIVAPSLSRFFKGAALKEETNRILALTRFARNESISQGVAIPLWFDIQSGEYGLENPDINIQQNTNKYTYRLPDSLKFDTEDRRLNQQRLHRIIFLPDGALDEESLYSLTIRNLRSTGGREWMRVAQSYNRLHYEIRDEDDEWQLRSSPLPEPEQSRLYLR
jgi:Tfp pilus assembly protein FimT